MPLGGAGRSRLVAGAVVAAAVAFGAGVAQPWASESGGISPGGGGATEVVETGIALDYHVAGIAELQDELIAVTSGGEVVRSRDGRAWEKVPASGFTPRTTTRREGGAACGGDTVRGVAGREGLLVAVGAQSVEPDPGDEYCNAVRKIWVSSDGATWKAVEPSGLAETDSLDTVVADTSGFLAFGYSRASPADRTRARRSRARPHRLALERRGDVGAGPDRRPEQAHGVQVPVRQQHRRARRGDARRRSAPNASAATTTTWSRSGDPTARVRGRSSGSPVSSRSTRPTPTSSRPSPPRTRATSRSRAWARTTATTERQPSGPRRTANDGNRRRWSGPRPATARWTRPRRRGMASFALDSTVRGLVVWRVESAVDRVAEPQFTG